MDNEPVRRENWLMDSISCAPIKTIGLRQVNEQAIRLSGQEWAATELESR